MPIYEYRCLRCGEVFSSLRITQKDEPVKCPHCASEDVKKIVSAFSSPSCSTFFSGGGG